MPKIIDGDIAPETTEAHDPTNGLIGHPGPCANPGRHHQAWMTPRLPILEPLERALGRIGLDPCSPGAGRSNVDALVHYVEDPADPQGGGLKQRWLAGLVFMNPPYCDPAPWCAKAVEATSCGEAGIVVGLLPVRTDAGWYRRGVAGRAHLLLLPKRVRFDAAPGVPGEHTANFPCMLVVWGGTAEQVSRLRAEFPGADFRPASRYRVTGAPERALGNARLRAATAARTARGGGARARSAKGSR